jgi:hypothetical protein
MSPDATEPGTCPLCGAPVLYAWTVGGSLLCLEPDAGGEYSVTAGRAWKREGYQWEAVVGGERYRQHRCKGAE